MKRLRKLLIKIGSFFPREKTVFDKAQEYFEWSRENGLYATIAVNRHQSGKPKIDFSCQAQSYKTAHDFARKFRITLTKTPSGTHGALDYIYEGGGVRINLYAIGELPPSCRVEYEDVVEPATPERTVSKAIVICN